MILLPFIIIAIPITITITVTTAIIDADTTRHSYLRDDLLQLKGRDGVDGTQMVKEV